MCNDCKFYSELKEPRQADEHNSIYGYCFKDQYNMGKGYPVYVPGGTCKDMKKARKESGGRYGHSEGD